MGHCIVWDSNNCKTAVFNTKRANGIPNLIVRFIVLGAIQFNYQTRLMAVEISNIAVNNLLPQKNAQNNDMENCTKGGVLLWSYSSSMFLHFLSI